MLTRIYNDILQEPGLHYRVGIAMCTLAGMGLSLGLLLRLSGNLLSNFGVRVDMLSGLPWPFHFLFPQSLLAAIPLAIFFAIGAWLAYSAHRLKKYL